MSEWQPIETAPKDGSRILARRGWKKFHCVDWDAEIREWRIGDKLIMRDITHWMPLPSPPEPRGQIEERALARDEGEAGNAEASLTHNNNEANK